MAKRKPTTKAKRTAKPRASKRTLQATPRLTQRKQGRTQRQEDVKGRTEDGQRAPGEHDADEHQRGEHFRGERNRGRQVGEPGSLEQETLDRRAPYNKTYGQ